MNDGAPAAAATNPTNFDAMMQGGGAPEPAAPAARRQSRAKADAPITHPGTELDMPAPGAQSKAPIPNLVPQNARGNEAPAEMVDEEGNPIAEDAPVEEATEPDVPQYDLSGPDLPAELLEKHVTVKINGKESSIPIAEAAKGYMRTADYTRKTQEVSAREVKVRNAETRINGKFEQFCDVRNVAQTVADLERFGLPMRELSAFVYEQWAADQKLSPTERASRAEAQRYQQQLEELHGKLAERDGNEQQQSQEQLAQDWNAIYQKHAPQALAANGLKSTPLTTKIFKESLAALWPQGAPLTPDIIQSAAVSTKEELQDLMAEGGANGASAAASGAGAPARASRGNPAGQTGQTGQPARRPLPTRGASGQPGVPGASRRGSIDDFDGKFFR